MEQVRPGPVPFDPDEPGLPVAGYRYELLNHDEVPQGDLEAVTGGSLSWDIESAVKATGSIDVEDDGSDIDWLRTRIRVSVILGGVDARSGGVRSVPLGVFLPAAPIEKWSASGRSWSVELTDKLAILDDEMTDADGNPSMFGVPAGQDVITIVRTLIHDAGGSTKAIEPGSAAVTRSTTWEPGTHRLEIINDLLLASGYSSLTCDGEGRFRTAPYVEPAQRPVEYDATTPFSPGQLSLMSPEHTIDRDVYNVPNRVAMQTGGDGEAEGMVAVATNENPDSPYSREARGRWITHTETGVLAMTQADLDLRARQRLDSATAVGAKVEVEHAFLPNLLIGRCVRYINPVSGLSMRCEVRNLEVPLDSLALCRSSLFEVTE